MKKRTLLSIVLSLALMSALSVSAFADVIWEPRNGFFQRHRTECVYVSRAYMVNSEKGYTSVVESPDSERELQNLPNGTEIGVDFVWENKGEAEWGTVVCFDAADPVGKAAEEGWIRLSELALVYGDKEFREDHAGEVTPYHSRGDEPYSGQVYSYPGGEFLCIMDRGQLPADAFGDEYTDENGLRWAYIGYYMGRVGGWMCLSDPENDQLGIEKARTVDEVRLGIPPIAPAEEIPEAGSLPVWVIPAALIVAAVCATAVILRKRRK